MMALRQNKVPMKYSTYIGKVPVMRELDDGHKVETGEYEDAFSTPQEFAANISMSGGNMRALEYGLSPEQYSATLVYQKGAYPLREGALVWTKSPIWHRDGDASERDMMATVTVVGDDGEARQAQEQVRSNFPLPDSADYVVVKISDSLSFTKAILKAVNK